MASPCRNNWEHPRSPHWEYLLSSVLYHPAYPQCSLSCSFKIFSSFFAIFFHILLFL